MAKTDPFQTRGKIFERIARMVGTMSSPARLTLIQFLVNGPQRVDTLAQMAGLSVANASQHLQKMAREGLVEAKREGVTRLYALRIPELVPVWEALQQLAHVLDPWMDQAEASLAPAD